MLENEIAYVIRHSIFNVYNAFGPGLFEAPYEAALSADLGKKGLMVARQVAQPVSFDGYTLDVGYRMDIVVEQKVVVEVKSVEVLLPVHHKQLITYLKLSGLKLGLLVNFNTDEIVSNIVRKVNGL